MQFKSKAPRTDTISPRQEECLSLSLQLDDSPGTAVVYCRGRIVFRDEAALLSGVVTEVLNSGRNVLLDLKGVHAVDSGGIGELVALHMWAQGCGAKLTLSGLSSHLRYLLELTNLASILEISPADPVTKTV